MMRKFFSLVIIIILALPFISFAKNEKAVIAKVGTEEITYEQLEKAFQRNMNRKSEKLSNVSKDSILNFLDLYINYRLKVLDAIDKGFENDSSVKADIAQNRKSLAESFYFDKYLLSPTMDYYMKQRQRAVKFGYILLTYSPDMAQKHYQSNVPMANDSAWIKAKEALNLIKSGKSFEDVAKDYSSDKEAAKNGGLINQFFTIGKLQRELDRALFTLKAGEVYPEVIKTSYGYFIIKMIVEEPRIVVKPSHILITFENDSTHIKAAAEKKADSLLALLKKGADFKKLAERNSDDATSAMYGGDMGDYYGRTSGFEKNGSPLIGEFVDVLFKLKDGEISDVVKSTYGFHIIKRDSSRPYNYEKDLDDIKRVYKTQFYEIDKAKFMDSVSAKHGFSINNSVLTQFLSKLDTTKTCIDSTWAKNVDDDLKKQVLYTYKKMTSTVGDFILKIKTTPKYRNTANTDEAFRKVMKAVVEPLVIEDATKNLEKEFPEFNALVKEFHNGMLLFKVEAQQVWDKLKFDSVAAKIYWDSTKTRYISNIMYDISEVFVMSDSTANEIYEKVKKGENFETLAGEYTVRSGLREKKGKWGSLDSKRNKFMNLLSREKVEKGLITKPQKFENGFTILKINKIEEPRQKTFEEAISEFAPAFQEIQQKNLMNKWLEKIKANHSVSYDKKAIEKLLVK